MLIDFNKSIGFGDSKTLVGRETTNGTSFGVSQVQAILFDKDKWDATKARNWLKKYKYTPIKYVHKTERFLRYRIRDPEMFNSFITKSYPDRGIDIIFGIPK